MKSHIQELYESHHQNKRAPSFSILKEERGLFISTAVGTGKNVLDLGCRDGALTAYFTKGNKVVGADIDKNALERAAKNLGIKTVFMDIYGDWSELEGKKFDAIVCGEVLEHLYYPEKILEKVAGHLTSEGMFIGSVPNAFSLKNRLRYLAGTKRHTPLSDPTHINHFSYTELEGLLGDHFAEAEVSGLGRYAWLAKKSVDLFAFDLVFVACEPKPSLTEGF